MPTVKAQYNPSTGKVSYNAATNKAETTTGAIGYPPTLGCCGNTVEDLPDIMIVKFSGITLPSGCCFLGPLFTKGDFNWYRGNGRYECVNQAAPPNLICGWINDPGTVVSYNTYTNPDCSGLPAFPNSGSQEITIVLTTTTLIVNLAGADKRIFRGIHTHAIDCKNTLNALWSGATITINNTQTDFGDCIPGGTAEVTIPF